MCSSGRGAQWQQFGQAIGLHARFDDCAGEANPTIDAQPYCVALKPSAFFHASEEVDPDAVWDLARSISCAGIWTTPLPVDRASGIVMDGNHRLRAAAALGLDYLPCVLLSYRDPRVNVTHWQTGAPFCAEHILRAILQNQKIFPYKTTRHFFEPLLPKTEIQLSVLRGWRAA